MEALGDWGITLSAVLGLILITGVLWWLQKRRDKIGDDFYKAFRIPPPDNEEERAKAWPTLNKVIAELRQKEDPIALQRAIRAAKFFGCKVN